MKAGSAPHSTTTASRTPTSPIRNFATADLREKYDVIIFPSIGGSSVSQVNGIPKTGPDPIPYKKTTLTPNLGVEDSSDDIRGGMGIEGLTELVKFVQAGGTLITEGSTTTILPDYGITTQVTVEHPTTSTPREP